MLRTRSIEDEKRVSVLGLSATVPDGQPNSSIPLHSRKEGVACEEDGVDLRALQHNESKVTEMFAARGISTDCSVFNH